MICCRRDGAATTRLTAPAARRVTRFPTCYASLPNTTASTPSCTWASAALSEATGKPILTATELAVADPANPGPATVRETGRLCYPSGNRAVTALGHLWRDAR